MHLTKLVKKGFFELVEIPLLVNNTVNALWPDGKRPQLHEKKRTPLGWEFSFVMPAAMCFRDFANREEYFRDAVGDVTTEMVHVGRLAILKVITKRIEKRYEYDWDYKYPKDMVLPIPIGYRHDGLHVEDLSKIPHVLVAGVTRSGKSNFIHTTVNSLLRLPLPPKIILIDLKRLEYTYLGNKVLLITDELSANMALLRTVAEMYNRIEVLKAARCVNIFKYNEKHNPMQHIVLIVDELAELDDERAQKDFERLATLSAAAGICLIAATQRPDAQTFKHFGKAKSCLLGRLSFKMADAINSKIVLDSDMATKIPNIRGRAIWKFDDPIQVQVPYIDPEEAEARLLEQPSKGSLPGCFDSRDTKRMGSARRRSIADTFVSLLQSSSETTGQTGGTEENKTLLPNRTLCLPRRLPWRHTDAD